MRLITHNMLQCHVKGCSKDNFPLKLEEVEVEKEEQEFNPDFIRHMLPKIEWNALRGTAHSLGVAELPKEMPPNETEDEELLRKIHEVLLETQIKEGNMVCGGCGHKYKITQGIPNMLLNEDEV